MKIPDCRRQIVYEIYAPSKIYTYKIYDALLCIVYNIHILLCVLLFFFLLFTIMYICVFVCARVFLYSLGAMFV